jgi:peptidyl-prolyl cis-trans isomerase A (cyclophilin A)
MPVAQRLSILMLLLASAGFMTPSAWSASSPADAAAAAQVPTVGAPAVTMVILQTELGDIHVALEKDRAPITAANFLRYVDLKRFDGISFYRAVKIGDEGKYGMVQGGLRNDPRRVFKPIAHEFPAVTGLSHLDGAISMAHTGPGTAVADFFFVIGDLPDLDGKGTADQPGYPVFGRVTQGMDVLRATMLLPRSEEVGDGSMKGQMLASPVKIISVRRAN